MKWLTKLFESWTSTRPTLQTHQNGMSKYLMKQVMDATFKNIPWSPPKNVYIALFTDNANDGIVELSTKNSGYSRVKVSTTNGEWVGPVRDNCEYSNKNVITFGQPMNQWGKASWIRIYDSPGSTEGESNNLLFSAKVNNDAMIDAGGLPPHIKPGQLKMYYLGGDM